MPWWGWVALAVLAVPVLVLISITALTPWRPDMEVVATPGYLPATPRHWGCGCVAGSAAILIILGLVYAAYRYWG